MADGPNALNSWESSGRSARHARDPELERMLRLLNDHLDKARALLPRPAAPQMPVVLVVGCARAGSTLLMQWLADSGLVSYASNLLSRFYKDPYIGALIHRVLFDLDHRGEVFPIKPAHGEFVSELGRTRGADAPHDFGYLWRNYFGFGELQSELTRAPDASGIAALRSDVGGMEQVFGKPVMLKAMELNWRIPLLRSIFPESVFLFIQRDPAANAASLLKARRSFYGDEGAWYSYKPAEYDALKELPPWEQAVAQVACTNRAVRAGLAGIPAEDAIDVRYEEFCANPAGMYARICRRLGNDKPYSGPIAFEASALHMDEQLAQRTRSIIDQLSTS